MNNKIFNDNDNLLLKESASIAQIAKNWAVESNFDVEIATIQLLNEARDGRFEYNLPSGIYSNFNALKLGRNKVYSGDLSDYLNYIYSYIRERLIYKMFYGKLNKISYPKLLTDFYSMNLIQKNTSVWGELNTITKKQGLKIFPKYEYDNHPTDEEKLKEGTPFWNWYNSLALDVKLYIKSNTEIAPEFDIYGKMSFSKPDPSLKPDNVIHITTDAAVGLLRYISSKQTREGLRASLINRLIYGDSSFDLKIEETGKSLSKLVNALVKNYDAEKDIFLLELANHIQLHKGSFLRWLRRYPSVREERYDGQRRFPEGNPIFWGDMWENQPASYEFDNENATEYSLYNAIRYWSEPDDIKLLEIYYKEIPEFNVQNTRNFNYQLLNNTDEIRVVSYNTELKKIYSKFLQHFKAGRLEMRGRITGQSGLQKIEYDDIEAFISSNRLDWQACEANNGEYIGIKVFKHPKSSSKTAAEHAFKRYLSEYSSVGTNPKITRETALNDFIKDKPQYKEEITTGSRGFTRAWKQFPDKFKLKGAPEGKRIK